MDQVFITSTLIRESVALDFCPRDTPQTLLRKLSCTYASHGLPETSFWWFEHNGRRWPASVPASSQGVVPGCQLCLHARLRGGGGDGGSTGAESRSSYLEMYQDKKPDKVNPAEELRARWTTCRLSGLPLSPPCCVDELGFLFNKEAVIQALMDKAIPKGLAHISSLKHLTDLQLTRTSSRECARPAVTTARNFQPGNEAEFACPITGLEMNGKYRFVVLLGSGHVISEKAVKQCPAAVEEHIGYKFVKADLLPINGTPEEVEVLREALLERRAAAKAKRVKKKAAHSEESIACPPDSTANGIAVVSLANKTTIHDGANGKPPVSGPLSSKRGSEILRVDDKVRAKRLKEALEMAPEKATRGVWASIFNSSTVEQAETYACRGNYGGLR
eukprot:jgi/Botrbrau1/18463/Bobra.0072s0046.1